MKKNRNKEVLILPSTTFSNIQWLSSFMAFEEVIIDPCENYIKQSFRNRYQILNHQGSFNLSLPVVGQKGKKVAVIDIKILDTDWQAYHWKTIISCYNSAPFFLYYKDSVEELIFKKIDSLFEFNMASLNLLLSEMGIEKSYKIAEKYTEGKNDLRQSFKGSTDFINDSYVQVFSDRMSFMSNLSGLDLLFNLGPESSIYLEKEGQKMV